MKPSDDIWNRATTLHLADKFDEAEPLYVQLLEQNPENAGLMATLGSLYYQTDRYGLAIHFLEASAKTLKEPDMYTNLGLSYKKANQPTKARYWLEKSIEENPTAEALTNYSGMFIECGEDAKCTELCERAIGMKPDLKMAHWNLSIAHLANGRWEKGWDEYEYGLEMDGVRENRDIAKVPYWDGEAGTVLVYGEQGMGDEIMFASVIPDLMTTNKVVIECHTRLQTLFSKSFTDAEVYGTREDRGVPSWVKNEKIDYRVSMGSLGKFYRRSKHSFPGEPYLKAEPLEKHKLRVGISWTGGIIKQSRMRKRSVPLVWLQSILSVKDVEFVSLQYTDSADEIAAMNSLGYDIKVMDEYSKANDYYETARLVSSCDLVISVCTSVVHLAGALGVPCWVMTPKWPAWRYQNEGPCPWYRSVRLYRQPSAERDAWLPVVERIAMDLKEFVRAHQRVLRIA